MALTNFCESNHEIVVTLLSASDVFEEAYGRISRKMFKRYIEQITKMFPEEDCFDSLIAFLFASVEVCMILHLISFE